MKGITKKLSAIFLAVIMAASSFALCASAEDYEDLYLEGYENYDDYTYDSIDVDGIIYDVIIDGEDSYASVCGFAWDSEGNYVEKESVVIPETVDYYGTYVTVTEISFLAFAECHTLREISLPATITSIYDYAFENAAYLEKVEIPATAEIDYFGCDVFSGTPVLGYLAEQSENGEIILGKNVLLSYLGSEKSYTVPEEITIIADRCFFMSGVEEIILNENITSIYPYTFASCRNLKEITIPEAVTIINEGAFSNCTSLEKVNLGNSLSCIGYRTFEGTKIKDIYLGDSMYDVIGAFAGCTTLENITISENNPYYTFEDDLLIFEESYEEGFVGYKSVEYFLITSDKTSVTVPSDVETIYSYAFYNCKQLDEVILTSPVYIGDYSFAYCEFDSFDFSKALDIGSCAFRGCKNLTSADLSSAYYIGDSAFENCTNLKDVTFGTDLWSIGSLAFSNTAIEVVVVIGSDCDIYERAFANCENLCYVAFFDGVWSIGNNVFANCPSLARVYISKTIEYIDYDAFDGCQNVVFEIIKGSTSGDLIMEYAEDDENDVTTYEIVGKVSFFTRIRDFINSIFARISEFLFGWISDFFFRL